MEVGHRKNNELCGGCRSQEERGIVWRSQEERQDENDVEVVGHRENGRMRMVWRL